MDQPELFLDQPPVATEAFAIGKRLASLKLPADTHLDDHQQEAFEDTVEFFAEGNTGGYINMPTGSGKTPVIVELAKRLREATPPEEDKPGVIVLAPTILLADQLLGSIDEDTGKKRGFKGFAPEIDARIMHSRMKASDASTNIVEAEALVSTYSSFRSLVKTFMEAESKPAEAWEAEKQHLAAEIPVFEQSAIELRRTRDEYVAETFRKQEITNAKAQAEALLARNKTFRLLSAEQVKGLQTVIEVVDTLPDNSRSTVKALQRTLGKLKNKNVDAGLAWMHNNYGENKKMQRAAQRATEKELGYVEEPLTEQELEDGMMTLASLGSCDQFVARFLWRHRAGRRRPDSSTLDDPVDRRHAIELGQQAADQRWRAGTAKSRVKAIEHMLNVQKAVQRIGLLVCDEAHWVMGSLTWDAIVEFTTQRNIALVGATASDENSTRTLEDYLPKAHELTRQEAIRREITNRMALFVDRTGLRFSNVGLEIDGEYDSHTRGTMRNSPERNQRIAQHAVTLSELGYQGIISLIPGKKGEHAKNIAALLNQTDMLDPKTGKRRLLRARYVLHETPKDVFDAYNKAYSRGEIDWLTYINVLGEGWDSDPAKALINARDTISPRIAIQRPGRIGRTYEGAPPSVVIDMEDEIELGDDYPQIPHVLAADIFEVDNVPQGHMVGTAKPGDERLIEAIRATLPDVPIQARYSRFKTVLESAARVDGRGIAVDATGRQVANEYQRYEAILSGFRGFLPKSLILEAAAGETPQIRSMAGRLGRKLIDLYNVRDVATLHPESPEVNPWKLYVDPAGEQWITPEGCTTLLAKRFPAIEAHEIEAAIEEFEATRTQPLTTRVGRVRLSFTREEDAKMGFTMLYKLADIVDEFVPFLTARA